MCEPPITGPVTAGSHAAAHTPVTFSAGQLVAPATRLLTDLHEVDAGLDRTVCGEILDPAEVWLPVEQQPGDRLCAACQGQPDPQPGLF